MDSGGAAPVAREQTTDNAQAGTAALNHPSLQLRSRTLRRTDSRPMNPTSGDPCIAHCAVRSSAEARLPPIARPSPRPHARTAAQRPRQRLVTHLVLTKAIVHRPAGRRLSDDLIVTRARSGFERTAALSLKPRVAFRRPSALGLRARLLTARPPAAPSTFGRMRFHSGNFVPKGI